MIMEGGAPHTVCVRLDLDSHVYCGWEGRGRGRGAIVQFVAREL